MSVVLDRAPEFVPELPQDPEAGFQIPFGVESVGSLASIAQVDVELPQAIATLSNRATYDSVAKKGDDAMAVDDNA